MGQDAALRGVRLNFLSARTAAEQEHRSIANMVEVMIREYCGRVGVPITERSASIKNDKKSSKPKK